MFHQFFLISDGVLFTFDFNRFVNLYVHDHRTEFESDAYAIVGNEMVKVTEETEFSGWDSNDWGHMQITISYGDEILATGGYQIDGRA